MDVKGFFLSLLILLFAIAGIAFVASRDVVFIGLAPLVIGPPLVMLKDSLRKPGRGV